MHSLFQEIDENEYTGKIKCKMHDIVHDFALYIRKSGWVEATRINKCTTCRDRAPSQISIVNEFRSLFWNGEEFSPNLCYCLTSLRVLSLRYCNLQSIPKIMENFIHLRLLDLSGNELSLDDLKIIFKLYNLKTLGLVSCRLKEIPIEIGNLIHLRHLNLSINISLLKLPKEIGSLINLTHLDLRYNKSLTELPREIGNLIHLTHLHLGSNESLTELPMQIGNLIHLKHLDLSSTGSLTKLPMEIWNLIHLTHLDLSSNESLEELPREIGNLVHLRHLNLRKNKSLRELPREIGNLIHLRHLDLSWNRSLSVLPREIGNLIHLRNLNLSENADLWELPGEIGNLIQLRHLNLSGSQNLRKLPETIRDLHELQSLNVEYCRGLCGIPQRLAILTSLSSLTEFKGRSTWSKLGLLKNLIHLCDSIVLHIKLGVDDLESVAEDVRGLELRKRIQIEDLVIEFKDEMDEKVEPSLRSRVRVRKDVIDALEPHPNLQQLAILKYKCFKLPGWMASPLNQLRKVHLLQCPHPTALPSLGKLPCLEEILICQMDKLETIGREFLGFHESSTSVISFPKLKTLEIDGCEKWKEWEDITAEEEASAATSVMPCLKELVIKRCDGLTSLPHRLLRKALLLEELHILGSTQLVQLYGNKDGYHWKSISQNQRLRLKI